MEFVSRIECHLKQTLVRVCRLRFGEDFKLPLLDVEFVLAI